MTLSLCFQENIELALDDTEPSTSLSVSVVDQASSQALVRSMLYSVSCLHFTFRVSHTAFLTYIVTYFLVRYFHVL